MNIGKKKEIVKFTIDFEFTESEDTNAVISDIVSFHDGQNIHERMEKAESVAKELGKVSKIKSLKMSLYVWILLFFVVI